jgi:aerobic C4-dicarboxylate transport protein
LLTSKGAAGVTGSGFIVLAASLSAVGHVPVEGLALIFGIDKFMSEARALTNLVGNGVATIVVGKWCHAVDEATLQGRLAPTIARPAVRELNMKGASGRVEEADGRLLPDGATDP